VRLRNPGRFYSFCSAFAPITTQALPLGRERPSSRLPRPRSHQLSAWVALQLDRLTRRKRLPLANRPGTPTILSWRVQSCAAGIWEEALQAAGHPLDAERQPGYNHSYFFIASFIDGPPAPSRFVALLCVLQVDAGLRHQV